MCLAARITAAFLIVQLTLPGDSFAAGRWHDVAQPVSLKHATHEQVVHALDRLTFGPRPGEIARVEQMGLAKWLDLQLDPRKIDDSALDVRLAAYPAMRLSEQQLISRFPPPPVIRAMLNGKGRGLAEPLSNPERAIYDHAIERARAKAEQKAQSSETAKSAAGVAMAAGANVPAAEDSGDNSHSAAMRITAADASVVAAVVQLPPDRRMARLCSMSAAQFDTFRRTMTREEHIQLIAGLTPEQREVLVALVAPRQAVVAETEQTKMLRAIDGNRELLEVMTDFWSNHFNVYMAKNGMAPYYIATYERDTIRPHALGKFEDLLVATARSPAMLTYLDNAQSIGPDSLAAQRRGRFSGKKAGLNENYARELMELHTVGVNGGYTQADVTEVAKVLTGWTTGEPKQGLGTFEFDERRHEPGSKTVMGHAFREGGEDEGRALLHMLATSPATAHFISSKLAVRFVSDDPPATLVDRMAATFLRSKGDIRDVLRTMVASPEFWSADAMGTKVKTPMEFVVSAARASGAAIDDPASLVQTVAKMGQPIFGMQTPNGYSQRAESWVGSGSLVGRMNFSLALASGRVPGVMPDWQEVMNGMDRTSSTAEQRQTLLETALLGGPASAKTHTIIASELTAAAGAKPPKTPAYAAKFADAGMIKNEVRESGKGNGRANDFGGDIFRLAPRATASPADPLDNLDPQTALIAGLLFGSPDFQRF